MSHYLYNEDQKQLFYSFKNKIQSKSITETLIRFLNTDFFEYFPQYFTVGMKSTIFERRKNSFEDLLFSIGDYAEMSMENLA